MQCPYTRRDGHEFPLELQARGPTLRERALGNPDRAGFWARLSLGMADRMHRVLLEKALGVHRDKKLPPFARQRFEGWAKRGCRACST